MVYLIKTNMLVIMAREPSLELETKKIKKECLFPVYCVYNTRALKIASTSALLNSIDVFITYSDKVINEVRLICFYHVNWAIKH